MSYVTRLIPATSFVILEDIFLRIGAGKTNLFGSRSLGCYFTETNQTAHVVRKGKTYQSAVMKSSD
jgi:hypothetical protein